MSTLSKKYTKRKAKSVKSLSIGYRTTSTTPTKSCKPDYVFKGNNWPEGLPKYSVDPQTFGAGADHYVVSIVKIPIDPNATFTTKENT